MLFQILIRQRSMDVNIPLFTKTCQQRTVKRQLIEYTNPKTTEQETATKGLKNFHKGLPKFIFNTDNSRQPI